MLVVAKQINTVKAANSWDESRFNTALTIEEKQPFFFRNEYNDL